MSKLEPPYYPIIYVRGYAMTQAEIEQTVSTPYMGFNLGATKLRQGHDQKIQKYIFESPLVRLMKDYKYKDIYSEGKEKLKKLEPKSIIIYRYYEQADSDIGAGEVPSIEEAAIGLDKLIERVRDEVCGSSKKKKDSFRVYLVAHSMGGLVCRCFLQNKKIGSAENKALVDKVFTYATPHNGIDMGGLNIPRFFGLWDMNNFNRKRMAGYLGMQDDSPERVDTLNDMFDPDRFFCLIGSNWKDYDAAKGLSSLLAGEMSDGLVKIDNAAVKGAPRAFVHRSHSGPLGIVNSEEGYQNLVRFLFGNTRVFGRLEIENLPLPPSVEKKYRKGEEVRASYFIEATIAPRGAVTYTLSARKKENYSAIFCEYDALFSKKKGKKVKTGKKQVLFSVFLDTEKIGSSLF